MASKLNPTKQKVLLLLLAGVTLGLAYTPRRQLKILKDVQKEWQKIDERRLKEEINELYRSKLTRIQENSDGTLTMQLTDKGHLKALTYHFNTMKIKPPSTWDQKWRIVVFDIPEKLRAARDALRWKLQDLGFHELQKSVFVFPYECKQQIDFLVEFYDIRKYVRYGVLESIDNDLHLRKIFRLV